MRNSSCRKNKNPGSANIGAASQSETDALLYSGKVYGLTTRRCYSVVFAVTMLTFFAAEGNAVFEHFGVILSVVDLLQCVLSQFVQCCIAAAFGGFPVGGDIVAVIEHGAQAQNQTMIKVFMCGVMVADTLLQTNGAWLPMPFPLPVGHHHHTDLRLVL